MTPFDSFALKRERAIRELRQFKRLLDAHSHTPPREREHILPFFASHRHAAALIGTYNFDASAPDRIAFEFDIFGDYKADLGIGNSQNHEYCFVEFEDATETSIIQKSTKAMPDWSRRFEHGFSQIIDGSSGSTTRGARRRTQPDLGWPQFGLSPC
jgi:hypothetical protein